MPESLNVEPTVSPVSEPPKTPSKWPIWVAILVILGLCAVLSWLVPSYKKVIKDYADTKESLSQAQTELVEWKKKTYDSTTFYPNGKPKRIVHYGTSSGIDSKNSLSLFNSDAVKTHEVTVTKRGMFTIVGGVDLNLRPAGAISYQILGPLTLGAGFSGSEPFVGGGLSF